MNDLMAFFIDKTSQTFADTLVVFGWSSVLTELHYQQKSYGHVTLYDDGPYYRLNCAPLQPETLDGRRSQMIWPGKAVVIETVKNASTLPGDLPHKISYEEQRDRVNAFYAARDKASDGQNELEKPHPHWDIFRAINPAALPGYNGLLLDWWTVRTAQPEIFSILFALFSQMPNDLDAAVEAWKQLDKTYGWGIKPFTTCQQLYNPDQGKGQNRAKANGLTTGNLDGFWLVEWLKLVGFYEAGMTRQVRGAKDRKTFVVAPRELTFADHSAVMSRFADTMRYSETSTKFDILAAIRYLKTLLVYVTEPDNQWLIPGLDQVNQTLVGGFYTAFYKDLGNAVATMNVAFIALPGWVVVNSEQDVQLHRELLDELDAVTRQFDESHSDAFDLLQHLRDFVSGDDITMFLRFTTSYAGYYIRMRERGEKPPAISTALIERITTIMGKTYADIGDKHKYPGFHNIARAISESTVIAQWRKAKRNNTTYQIRYGLNQEFARKAYDAQQFLEVLGEFIHTYNAETSRAQELGLKPWRPMVETNDIGDVLKMIDDYDGNSRMVAQLLIAYGYTFMKSEDTDTTQENE